jgi:hypothetical protein
MAMAERRIASIAEGDERHRSSFVLTYADGGTERRPGSLAEASELARNAGLCLVPTANESILWRRGPDPAPGA